MSTHPISITTQLTFQQIAALFTALAQSERGDMQPLMRILHPVEPPPPPAPVAVVEPQPELPVPATVAEAQPVPPAGNKGWGGKNITLADDTIVEACTKAMERGELVSNSNYSWQKGKHDPRSPHNQRVISALRTPVNRTLSYTSLRAQTGINNDNLLKSYLREMEKQGLITATRIRV